ncbi:MAG: hypothetical protein IKI94_04220 [Ruminococcus sp.]|nr:hypothetical protein [Ruminococcus sp.]
MKESSIVQTNFINGIKAIRDYWLSLPEKPSNEVVDGVIHSILVMIDGDSSVNDFHPLQIIDEETQERIDCGYLHELYFQ